MSNTPSDEELNSVLCHHWPAFSMQAVLVQMWLRDAMRAALAKWGTPTAGEPVAYRHMHDDGWEYYDAPTGSDCPGCEALCKCTQPVVREPLTCEWTHNDDDGYWDTSCGKAWRFDDGGPKENNMNFCHCCGKTLRIKGGQHGTDA